MKIHFLLSQGIVVVDSHQRIVEYAELSSKVVISIEVSRVIDRREAWISATREPPFRVNLFLSSVGIWKPVVLWISGVFAQRW